MTKITRDIILDLMPLYMAGEASEDTRTLIEEYLKSDKELAKMAEHSKTVSLPSDVPAPLERDQELQLYIETKRQMTIRMAIIVSAIVLLFLIGGAAIVLLTG